MADLKDLKDMSDDERKEAALDFGKKIDETVGEKFRAVKGWFLKIFGGLLILIGVIVLLAGGTNAGLGILGGGIAVFAMGLRNLSMMVQRIVLGAGIMILGAAFVNYGFGQMAKAKESVNWPSVNGKIISSELEKRTTTEGTGSNKRTKTYYVAVINYEYKVDGVSFTSNKVAFAAQIRHESNDLVRKYPKGKSVSVYYDPDNPKIAVLETGMKKASYFLPAFGGFFMLTGLLIAYKGIKK